MKITMLTAYFPPEVGSASHLFFELGTELARRGHEVTVLTGYPSYNIDTENLPPQYKAGWWMKEMMSGIHVIRVRAIGMPRHVPVLRGIDQFTFSVMLSFGGLILTPFKPDIILVYSPPLFLGMSALFLRRFQKNKVVINIQDLFPQNAIDLGLLKSNFLIRIFQKIESHLYKKADSITVHSAGNMNYVLHCGGIAEKTKVVPNLVDTKTIIPGTRNNSFRKENNIGEKEFIVSFAGVIGYSQDLDTVIDAAKLLSDFSRVKFYIVGEGIEKKRLIARAEGMSNVQFLPMLPRERYVELLHASDVCLATLRSEVKTPVVPSKILSIMAAGRAVVASLPLEGDASVLIEEAQCGVSIEPENPAKLAEVIKVLYNEQSLVDSYGRNGRKYVEQHCSLEVCGQMYEELFRNLQN